MLPIHELKQKIEPTALIIFGATGELSQTRLLPALSHLHDEGLLPKQFSVVGFARTPHTHRQFRALVKKSLAAAAASFLKKIYYCPGNFGHSGDFRRLGREIHNLESRGHSCANRLFYFATLPMHYETISHGLSAAGLLRGCTRHRRATRVVVEKPFGHDAASARKLDGVLQQYFREEQIYRIDHYLGKETVQNLLTARFANGIFEPVWNRGFIDHVQISALEEAGIGNRGALYEQSGALRDVVQNHLMQLLALIAMEEPRDLSADAVRQERAAVVRTIKKTGAPDRRRNLAVGQYRSYREEKNVSENSRVETFAALRLQIDNPRWAGVPFYLRTGKRLQAKATEISIHFKTPAPGLFQQLNISGNVLRFKIHPQEGLFLELLAKYPGFGIRLHPVTMELGYTAAFSGEIPGAYQRLLLDFMQGDQRLFARSDEIEEAWRFIDPLENFLVKNKITPETYAAGSWGPKAAGRLIEKDNRQWLIK